MAGRQIAVLYLRVPKNDLDTLRRMAQPTLAAIERLQPGTIVTFSHPDMR